MKQKPYHYNNNVSRNDNDIWLFFYLTDKTNCSIPCIGTLETTNSDYCINHGIDCMLLGQSNTIMHEEFFNFSKCIITTITIKCDFLFQKGEGHFL